MGVFFTPGCNILMYHRVTNPGNDPQLLSVSPKNFEEQVVFLKKHRRLLTVDEFDEILNSKKTLPAKSVLITLDDGYADNYQEALPILERHEIQALFFISTAHIDTLREFWWDDLERIFLENSEIPKKLSFNLGGNHYDITTETRFDITKAYRQFHKIIKPLDTEKREELLNLLCVWANLPRDGRLSCKSMTRKEIRQLSLSSSVIIGAHSHNHVSLSALSAEMQRKEIVLSKKILEDITEKPVKHFSYPFGSHSDYTRESIAICKELNFTSAFSGFPGIASKTSERFELPRIIVRNWNAKELAEHI
ncbi:MAG: polysaccharide deacetylase family protein [Candidatus Gracilibacteria bacterium]